MRRIKNWLKLYYTRPTGRKKYEEKSGKKKERGEVDSMRLGGANRRFTSQTMFDPYLYAKGHKSHIL